MSAVTELLPALPVRQALAAMGGSHATWYRRQQPRRPRRERRGVPPLALLAPERETILQTLNSERYADCTPYTAWARLLDEGVYLASVRTFYRVLAASGMVNERRAQLIHPAHAKPELIARAPHQVWSWDITKLRGPGKWTHYSLYVILDIYSRCVVGWMVSYRESAKLAEHLIAESCRKQGIEMGQLTIHADRGSSMTSKPVALLLSDLGVIKTHSRPHVSNDNPFSESQFRTMKYRPEFPERFGSLEDARQFCRWFFQWYNNEHRHSGLGLLTPAAVHHGQADRLLRERRKVLEGFYGLHPERFVKGHPVVAKLPEAVWINPPVKTTCQDAPRLTVSTPAGIGGVGTFPSTEVSCDITGERALPKKDRFLVEAVQ